MKIFLQTIQSYAFSKCKWYSPIYFPNLEEIGNYAFQEAARQSSNAGYNIYCPKLISLGTGAFNPGSSTGNVLILKTLPILGGIPDWGNTRKMTILLSPDAYDAVDWENEANWNSVKSFVVRATTFAGDRSKYWAAFINKGILTEQEIRRDYYGEEV